MSPSEDAMDRQLVRLEGQVDRFETKLSQMTDRLDATYVRKEVFVSELATMAGRLGAIEESGKWTRRTILGALLVSILGMVGSVVAALIIQQALAR